VLGIGIGATSAADVPTAVAAIVVVALILALELVHAGRRLALGEAPPELDVAAAVAALVSTALIASVLALPIPDALAKLGRPLEKIDPLLAMGTVIVATILIIAARMLRPLVPNLDAVASRLQRFVWAADPVPAGVTSFRALERAVTITSSGFALFEQRAGVWLAAVLIFTLLVWSTRP
jgi:hypothetical protein